MKCKRCYYLVPVFWGILLLSFSPPADAIPIGSRADLSSGLTTIDFEDLAPNGASILVDSQYAAQGITFEGAEINAIMEPFYGRQLFAIDESSPAVISGYFSGSVNVIGLDFVSTVPLTLIAYDANQNEIESTDSGLATSGFLGLQTTSDIAFFKLHDHGRNFFADNISFGLASSSATGNVSSVPEPGTLLLLGSGLLGIGILGRKIKL